MLTSSIHRLLPKCRMTTLLTTMVGAVNVKAERIMNAILITLHFVIYKNSRKNGRCIVSHIAWLIYSEPMRSRSTWLNTAKARITSGTSHRCTLVRSRKWISIMIHKSTHTNKSSRAGENVVRLIVSLLPLREQQLHIVLLKLGV